MNRNKVVRRLKVIQREVDEVADRALRQGGIEPSCHQGCSACCYALPMVTIVEAIRMIDKAGYLFWNELKPEIDRQAELLLSDHSMTTHRWFNEKHGCPFLSENLCSIYPARPTMCRTYFVVSDPKHCGGVSGTDVSVVNTRRIREAAFYQETAVSSAYGLPVAPAPLPVAVSWAAIAIQHGAEALHAHLVGTEFLDPVDATERWLKQLEPESWEERATNAIDGRSLNE